MIEITDLHLAECIEALELLAKRDSISIIKSMKVEAICNAAEKIFKHSQSCLRDQERAYIYLRRFLLVYETLLSLPHCDKQFVRSRLGPEVKIASDQFAEIKSSLETRYKLLRASMALKKRTVANPAIVKPDVDTTKNMPYQTKDEFISCRELYRSFERLNVNLLVMDARPADDYRASSMKQINGINIPEDVIREGLSANLLGKVIPETSQERWNKRETFTLIVLIDWTSTPDTYMSLPLGKLKDILMNWDLVKYEQHPVVLNGGYLEWLETYPMLCTNPQVVHTKANTTLDELLDLDDISYPSMADKNVSSLCTPTSRIFTKPVVNRAIKPLLPSRDILIQQEQQVAEQQLKIEEELVTLEKEVADKSIDETQTNTNIEDLLKRIQDLEKSKEDLEDTNSKLQQQIELYASFDPANVSDNTYEMRIQDITAETKKMSEQRDSLAKKREDLLREARKNKENITNQHILMKPTAKKTTPVIPTINRTIKPMKKRDFRPKLGESPAGITGLENVGNICFMNSIIQCLSNTTFLTDYFCMGKYRDYIKEETAGTITIEFAAVIRTLWSGKYQRIYMESFKEEVAKYSPRYRGTEHQDAHELLQTVINWLHDELKYDVHTFTSQSPSAKAWNAHFENKCSDILKLFFYQLRTERTCSTCNKSSTSFETRQDLMVDVPQHPSTLEECVRALFKPETMNDWVCSNCKTVRILKSVTAINTLPPILIVTLKRFSEVGHVKAREFMRNNNELSYPLKLRFGGSSYHLYAICEHMGTLQAGHYTATCYNRTARRWVYYNDERITLMGTYNEYVMTPATAYILFYSIEAPYE